MKSKFAKNTGPASFGAHPPARLCSGRIIPKLSPLFFALFLFLIPLQVISVEETPASLQNVGINERLGNAVSLDLNFVDESGQKIPLKTYFDGKKPVILILAYYECPNICNYLLQGTVNSLAKLAWPVGEKFEVVVISIDPKETPAIAVKKREAFKNWHLLTGEEKNIQQVASEVGFQYRYEEETKQYAHGAGIFLLTPAGQLARALHGIEFSTRDLKLALVEASQGKIGSVVDRLMFYCYRYDSTNRRYVFATNLMKGGGAATVLLLGFLIFRMGRKPFQGKEKR